MYSSFKNWENLSWEKILANSLTEPKQLSEHLVEHPVEYPAEHQPENMPENMPKNIIAHLAARAMDLELVAKTYPMQINPYVLSLIKIPNDPIWRQVVPDVAELDDSKDNLDPLNEENQSPVPNLIHRYPDRVVFLISARCGAYCRFCMRKRVVGHADQISRATIDEGLKYIRLNPAVQEVILSGGDPFLLKDKQLGDILQSLRNISHIKIIRIHTRVLCTLPQRITPKLAQILKAFHPLYINTHFNHPFEITRPVVKACNLLADAGIPLGCQTVLLKGVNDDSRIMAELMRRLVQIRVKPYYLHHPDQIKGTKHFQTSLESGLKIMKDLRGFVSGLCVPQYMLDLPGGGGKIPLTPEYIIEKKQNSWVVRNYKGEIFEYLLKN